MRKLSRVRFTPSPNLPDPESQDVQLGSQLLIAGKDRGFDQHGEKLVDVELTDDEANRRVLLQVEGEEDSFVPYERVCKGWFVGIAEDKSARGDAVNCVDATAGPKKEPQEPHAQSGWQSVAPVDPPFQDYTLGLPDPIAAAKVLYDNAPLMKLVDKGAACPHCDKTCADARGLASHVRAKHPG